VAVTDDAGAGGGEGDPLPSTVLGDRELARVTIDSDGIVSREGSGGAFQPPVGGVPDDGGASGPAVTAKQEQGDFSCYRVGPFRQAADWEDAVAWVKGKTWKWEHVRSESRELRAVRVYLGPYDSIGAAQTTIDMLKQKDLDHFVYLREGKARISLGYFTQEELATKYVDYLTGQEIQAQSQPEYRTLGPFNWMDIMLESVERSGLLGRQWNADDVNVAEKDCPADS
jgi:hypothetical protein